MEQDPPVASVDPDAPRPRVVSPPVAEFEKLRTPLWPGERLVFDLFNENLDEEWAIYVQPPLNGLEPDIVLLHPRVGIAVFEVKDWDLSACDWRIETLNGRPRLVGRDDRGHEFAKPNPFLRLAQYRREISELYCPALARRAGLAAISSGLIFPFADDAELLRRFGPGLDAAVPTAVRRYMTLTGAAAVAQRNLEAIFPGHRRRSSSLMTPELADDLRHWLVESDFSAEQRETPVLSRAQRGYVSVGTDTGFRRLRGPAGSGKSLVLAGRASTLAQEGRDVLVVSFNITLLNYLRDCAGRFGRRNAITWLHFHGWCRRVFDECGLNQEWRSLPWKSESMIHESLAAAVRDAIQSNRDIIHQFDAILVDEGQDFHPGWWDALRQVLKPGGEMLLVADRAQDLYGRNLLWTERAMEGAGFRGPWASLEGSYRMPAPLIELTARFVSEFLQDGQITPPSAPDQQELDVDPVELRWLQVSQDRLVDASVEAIRESVIGTDGTPPRAFADVVFICDHKELGRKVVTQLNELGVRASHTFADDDREALRQKRYFFKGDSRVKATTIHSFKGWECRHLVVAIGRSAGETGRSAIYTALTRLKRHPDGSHLTVVCSSPEVASFGRTWPAFASD